MPQSTDRATTLTGTGDHRTDPRDVRAAGHDSPDPLLADAAGDERNVVPTPTRPGIPGASGSDSTRQDGAAARVAPAASAAATATITAAMAKAPVKELPSTGTTSSGPMTWPMA
ncbi:hypothetical protein SAMN05421776_102409 [Nocardia farcinica]|uniref:Uncharacterized protein n=1 Tax=Nocardia farcinica TaxID=37329 RepID=A0A0H5P3J3_NOCFR|nr:Uncharacterised protein [Nocardia farcinica]SIS93799.1 hypothetical protein SAMN05421776_102409 [Nocardia farcinica]